MTPRKPRRVLLIVQNCSVPFDQRVWLEAVTLRNSGYEVTVICPREGSQAKRETLHGIRICRHPSPPEASGPFGYALEYGVALFWEFLLTSRLFLTKGFDVLHASNPPDTIFIIGGLFKHIFSKKFIFDQHDICPELYEAKFGRRDALFRLISILERLSFRVADVVISTNESYRKIALERGGVDPSRVFVVRNGPNLNRIHAVSPVESLKHGRRYLVGYVGIIGAQEGLQYLIKAARHVIHECKRTDVHFGIVGSGSALANMRQLANDLRVEKFFTFAGRVSDDILLKFLSTADLCINSDEYNTMNDKSTMIKIMEYMAVGKPIVQFDLSEGRVTAERASLYARPNDPVDLANKIMELLDDPERRAVMGRYGRERIECHLEWMHQAPKLLAAYDALWAADDER